MSFKDSLKPPSVEANEALKPVSVSRTVFTKIGGASGVLIGAGTIGIGIGNILTGHGGRGLLQMAGGTGMMAWGSNDYKVASAATRSRNYVQLKEQLDAQAIAQNAGYSRA